MINDEISYLSTLPESRSEVLNQNKITPPAVPLLTSTPYFSVWSASKHPGKGITRHWTGTVHPLTCFIRIDGQNFRALGDALPEIPVMFLVSTKITPTRTIYTFEHAGIKLVMTFTAPFIPSDLKLMSLPLTYISWDLQATDGRDHDVSIYFDAASDIVVNEPSQEVIWSRANVDGLDLLRIGSKEQNILHRSGDNMRIDWGYLYLAADKNNHAGMLLADQKTAKQSFLDDGTIPSEDDLDMPRAVSTKCISAIAVFKLFVNEYPVERNLVLAYDEKFSIEYFHRRLKPYWTEYYRSTSEMLKDAVKIFPTVTESCKVFDNELTEDLKSAGGEDYANLSILSYRQAISAHAFVADSDGSPLLFSKENFSNGCIATVDVIYPTAPLFLLFNSELFKASLKPVLEYSMMKRWKFPYAPHDLGTYPIANGQVYGGGEDTDEDQMPVEECGNMLLLMYAVSYIERNVEFASKYWTSLEKWANYLKLKGLNPENQLCTDDFAGHLACNVNLSVKAILAMAAYSKLCELSGKTVEAEEYMNLSKAYAKEWELMAYDDDHYRLAFNKPGTWSQKYNLIWDKIFDLNIFSEHVFTTEINYYKTKMKTYGLPLDSRRDYTKIDWLVWTASLADNQEDFELFVSKAMSFVNETPDNVPLTDWYDTITGKQVGFQARSVVGGIFIKMMMDKSIWSKWLNLD